MDRVISTISLDVGYGKDQAIVKDVSLDVAPSEVVAIIGANGAGKSTILKTIIRQLHKLNGDIRICELDEAKLTDEDMATRVSMVMTERINPELMTGFDIVATGRYPYTGTMGLLTDKDIEIVNRSIELVGATAVADMDFAKLSDGQRQRVMLARAICQDTPIMILDEPTSFLDVQYKLDILALIRRLAKEQGKAIILSIHELEYVPAIADKVVAVADNSVYQIGTPEEIITGDNLEKMYHMTPGTGETLAAGLWHYAKALESMLFS